MHLLQMSLTGTVMIMGIVFIRMTAKQKLPRWMYVALWSIVVIRLLLPVSFGVPVPFARYPETVGITRAPGTSQMQSGIIEEPASDKSDNPVTYPPRDNPQALLSEKGFDAYPIFFRIWLCGMILLFCIFFTGHIKGRMRYATGLPFSGQFIDTWRKTHRIRRRLRIVVSDRVDVPLTYGVWHPVILVPKLMDLSDERTLLYVLEHEYMHIRRFDVLTKWLLTAALCVHWFNPFVWLMYILMNRDMEMLCDECVIRKYGPAAKSDYAFALVDISSRRMGFCATGLGFGKNAIEERIVTIMKLKKTSLAGIIAAVLLLTCAAAGFATALPSLPKEPIAIYATSMNGSAIDRTSNVRTALAKFNGLVVEPGQTISFNEIVGKRTEANGFKAVYEDNSAEKIVGEGACQAATTLYGALLNADMTPVTRYSHAAAPDYVPLSLDAAVDNEEKDLVFQNNTSSAISIHTEITDNSATVFIYGKASEYRIDLESVHLQTIMPDGIIEVPDLSGDYVSHSGEMQLKREGREGASSEAYRVYRDRETGAEVKREKLSSDYYSPLKPEYWVGIGAQVEG